MSSQTFANGTTLNSSALTPDTIATIFQSIVLQVFGITVDPANPDAAYRQVRIGWAVEGEPAWLITEDVCIVLAYPATDAYSLVRDELNTPNDDLSILSEMSYNQLWRIHFTLYGPNAYDRARLISSAMALDWVRAYLASPPPPVNTALYMLAEFPRPVYGMTEPFQGQWWRRADLDLRFNELVREEIAVSTALGVDVTLVTETIVIDIGA